MIIFVHLLNWALIKEHLSDDLLIVFDPSYIPKSGKKTAHKGKFWSGCLGKAAQGLEIGELCVVDVAQNTGLHLKAFQTLNKIELEEQGITLPTFYANKIIGESTFLEGISPYLVVDGYFTKESFFNNISEQTNLEIISKLRTDADLKYLYNGPKTGKRGRPRLYAGKVDLKNIDKRRFRKCFEDDSVTLYECICRVVNLKINAKIVYAQFKKEGEPYQVYCSTDNSLKGQKIYEYYKARFQVEFLLRDGKQHTGLTHCQSIKEEVLDFQFNMSLSAVNLAKVRHYLTPNKIEEKTFSMADIKTLYFNELMLKFFLSNFDFDPENEKNKIAIQKFLNLGSIAA